MFLKDMSKAGVIATSAILGGCTIGPAASVELRSAEATGAYWFYETSLSGLNPVQRKAHVLREMPTPTMLPRTITARIGSDLWIVPVCNGNVRWDMPGVYQVPLTRNVNIVCPR